MLLSSATCSKWRVCASQQRSQVTIATILEATVAAEIVGNISLLRTSFWRIISFPTTETCTRRGINSWILREAVQFTELCPYNANTFVVKDGINGLSPNFFNTPPQWVCLYSLQLYYFFLELRHCCLGFLQIVADPVNAASLDPPHVHRSSSRGGVLMFWLKCSSLPCCLLSFSRLARTSDANTKSSLCKYRLGL